VVEEIEEVSPELDLVPLANVEAFHNREVHAFLKWTAVDVAHAWAAEAGRRGISCERDRYRIAQTGLTSEIKIVSQWAWVLAAVGFICAQFFFNVVVARQSNAPPAWAQLLLGLLLGLVLGCFLLFIGHINRDAKRRGMTPVLWTIVALLIPNALGIIFLFHPVATAAQCLPAMWERRPVGIQLLPSLQLQTEPELSEVPARGCRK
jgi:hypothetical protein